VITERDLESVCSIVNCLCRITTDYGVVKTGALIDFANTGAFLVPGIPLVRRNLVLKM
jgi:hypothetical protein